MSGVLIAFANQAGRGAGGGVTKARFWSAADLKTTIKAIAISALAAGAYLLQPHLGMHGILLTVVTVSAGVAVSLMYLTAGMFQRDF